MVAWGLPTVNARALFLSGGRDPWRPRMRSDGAVFLIASGFLSSPLPPKSGWQFHVSAKRDVEEKALLEFS